MSDIWISAFTVVSTEVSDAEKIKIGTSVIRKLKEQYDESYGSNPVEVRDVHIEITVGTS